MSAERVFGLTAEEGTISILREVSNGREIFHYEQIDKDPLTDPLFERREGYGSFSALFGLVAANCPWYLLQVNFVHDDYRNFVIGWLMQELNEKKVPAQEIRSSQQQLEQALGVRLQYGYRPVGNGMMQISIENLVKFTEFEHDIHRNGWEEKGNGTVVPKATFELWLAGSQSFRHDQVTMCCDYTEKMEVTGRLDVNGGCIIIRNESDEISHLLPSDKFFVTAKPAHRKTKSWFYMDLKRKNKLDQDSL